MYGGSGWLGLLLPANKHFYGILGLFSAPGLSPLFHRQFIDNETQFFLFKASFLFILDFYICSFTNFQNSITLDTDKILTSSQEFQALNVAKKLVYLSQYKKIATYN